MQTTTTIEDNCLTTHPSTDPLGACTAHQVTQYHNWAPGRHDFKVQLTTQHRNEDNDADWYETGEADAHSTGDGLAFECFTCEALLVWER